MQSENLIYSINAGLKKIFTIINYNVLIPMPILNILKHNLANVGKGYCNGLNICVPLPPIPLLKPQFPNVMVFGGKAFETIRFIRAETSLLFISPLLRKKMKGPECSLFAM